MTMHRGAVASLLLLTPLLVVTSAGSTDAFADEAAECPSASDGALDAQSVDGVAVDDCGIVGERVTTDDGALAVLIPAPGSGVSAFAMYDGDTDLTHTFSVYVDPDGSATVQEDAAADPAATSRPARRALGACDPGASSYYIFYPGQPHWTSTFNWRINTGSIPSNLNSSDTVDSIRNGVQNWTTLRNNCGESGGVSGLSVSYNGSTTTGANIGTAGSCNNSNGTSTATFGQLDGSLLGYGCMWWNGSYSAVEGDLKLDNTSRSWTLTGGSGCSGSTYDVESVATHEFGHTLGLDDLGVSGSDNQTMYGSTNPCDVEKRTLGIGDITGIRILY